MRLSMLIIKWAILAGLYHNNQPSAQRISKKSQYDKRLNFDSILFPVAISDFSNFERQNDVSINVFTLQRKSDAISYETVPIYLTIGKKTEHVNLLMIFAEDELSLSSSLTNYNILPLQNNSIPLRYHYCTIKNLSKLVSSQVSKHNGRLHICDRCLNYFFSSEKLSSHYEKCISLNKGKIELPSVEDSVEEFNNFKFSLIKQYIIYADIKSILAPSIQTTVDHNSAKYQDHIPSSVGFYLKDQLNPGSSFYDSKRGVDCMEWFCNQLKVISYIILNSIENPPFPNPCLTNDEENEYQRSNYCHLCSNNFEDFDAKVKSHCPITGVYRGAAHRNCKLKVRDNYTIPVVFHNLSSYDAHFIIFKMCEIIDGSVSITPINTEKSISFTYSISRPNKKFP